MKLRALLLVLAAIPGMHCCISSGDIWKGEMAAPEDNTQGDMGQPMDLIEERMSQAEWMFDYLDSDNNGDITMHDLLNPNKEKAKVLFNKLDANHDGHIDIIEIYGPHRNVKDSKEDVLGDMRGHIMDMEGQRSRWQLFQKLDTNGNYLIELKEIQNPSNYAAKSTIEWFDGNDDGKVNYEEFKKAIQQ